VLAEGKASLSLYIVVAIVVKLLGMMAGPAQHKARGLDLAATHTRERGSYIGIIRVHCYSPVSVNIAHASRTICGASMLAMVRIRTALSLMMGVHGVLL